MLASAEDIAAHVSAGQRLIYLLNKADAVPVETTARARRALAHLLSASDRQCLILSAREKVGLEDLRQALVATYGTLGSGSETTLVANIRHVEALQNAATSLSRVQQGLTTLPTDLLAQDLRESLHHLGTITGEITTDQILGEIFGKFCIGK
jgi:tRNA modification GTPase